MSLLIVSLIDSLKLWKKFKREIHLVAKVKLMFFKMMLKMIICLLKDKQRVQVNKKILEELSESCNTILKMKDSKLKDPNTRIKI